MGRPSWLFSRTGTSTAVGVCLGISLSIIFAPFIDESCHDSINIEPMQPNLIKARKTNSVNEPQEVRLDVKVKSENELDVPPAPPLKKVKRGPGGKPIRPRYASTELGIREKLFVAVITSKGTVDTAGASLNRTLAHYVTKITFFMEAKGTVPPGMGVVSFSDKSPHLLPLHILKYISDHYAQVFDYYLFVSDLTYLRGEKVFDFVSGISVSRDVHIGAPNPYTDTEFCGLDGGVILSQSVLSRTIQELDWCMTHAQSNNPSVNFGKCVLHGSRVGCSATVGTHEYRNYRLSDFHFDEDISSLQTQPQFREALAVYPMPNDLTVYKLHRYYCQVELNNTQHQIAELKDNIIHLSQYTPGGTESLSWPIGVPEPFKPKNKFDVIRWDYFTEENIYFEDDFTNVNKLSGVNKLDVEEVLATAKKKLEKKHRTVYKTVRLVNGYRRFDPTRGMEYTLDLRVSEGGKLSSFNTRVHLVRPLGFVEIIPLPYVTENTRLTLVLPVRVQDKKGVVGFLDSYAHVCLDSGDNTNLFIVFVYEENHSAEEDIFSSLKSMISYYENKYQNGAKIAWSSLTLTGSYLSEITLMDTISKQFNLDSLLVLCTVGIELSSEYLNRVRMNTIARWQVFFPIGFWQYIPHIIYEEKPYPTTIEINRYSGHFDINAYDHSSFYNSDYVAARKALAPGEELSSDLFSMFVNYKKIHIFRAVEPNLRHKFTNIECPGEMPKRLYDLCQVRKLESYATRAQLAMLVFEHKQKQEQDAKDLQENKKEDY